jgi:hypothetical protein
VARSSIEDAARAASIGDKTLRRWIREPEFKAKYLQARLDHKQDSFPVTPIVFPQES